MAQDTTIERKPITVEDVPPNVMKLVDVAIHRYGISRTRTLPDLLEAISNFKEEN